MPPCIDGELRCGRTAVDTGQWDAVPEHLFGVLAGGARLTFPALLERGNGSATDPRAATRRPVRPDVAAADLGTGHSLKRQRLVDRDCLSCEAGRDRNGGSGARRVDEGLDQRRTGGSSILEGRRRTWAARGCDDRALGQHDHPDDTENGRDGADADGDRDAGRHPLAVLTEAEAIQAIGRAVTAGDLMVDALCHPLEGEPCRALIRLRCPPAP